MMRRTKLLVSAVAALAVGLGTAGTAYAVQHQDRALPRTSIAGLDVAGKTQAQIASALRDRSAQVRLTVRTPSGSRTATLAQLGYAVDAAATARQVLAVHSIGSYARALVSDASFVPVVTSNPAALASYAASLVPTDRVRAKDASVQLAAGTASFTVTPAVVGARPDPSDLATAAAASAHDLTSRTVQVKLVDVAPAVSTRTAQVAAAKANSLVTTAVKVTLGDTSFKPSSAERASWVTLPRLTASAVPTVDQAKITAWVAARADASATAPVNGRRLVTSSGTVVRVTREKVDGRTVTNAAAVARAMRSTLTSGKAYTGSFAARTVAATWTDKRIAEGAQSLAYQASIGEKWIDVNLSRHTMTAYLGGEAVLGPVAMVNGAPATPSVVGTYHINRKYTSDRMRGSNADGSLYDTPDVPWVSYFQGGYALHGAPWRSTFGYAASHGCINLPVSTAKWLFDWAPIGTPVVSHN